MTDVEKKRQALQDELDSHKPHTERNMMGQFATPYNLAVDIMKHAHKFCHTGKTSFLEPAMGTGVFFSAFTEVFNNNVGHACGFEIDPYYFNPTKKIWNDYDIDIKCEDFFSASTNGKRFDLIVANPPYVRHHYIKHDTKLQLKHKVKKATGINISGLAGLYCYFMILSTEWLKEDGVSCWLVPCEFMDVNYGKAVRQYLLENVELLHIHRFNTDDLQFSDALVSSCIVTFKKSTPTPHTVSLSTGENIARPYDKREVRTEELAKTDKWSLLFSSQPDRTTSQDATLGNFFTVKRGIATGDNKFFIINKETINKYSIPQKFLKPVLPSPRYLTDNIICGNDMGLPVLPTPLYLFTCDMDESSIRNYYPGVWKYIQVGIDRGVDCGYICSRRSPWYSCENRDPAPIVMSYMGRSGQSDRLFRFILNDSIAVTTNVYLLLYPKINYNKCLKDKDLLIKIWQLLNLIPTKELINNGRSYGGGLSKIEPKELMKVQVPGLAKLMKPMEMKLELPLFE